MGNMHDLMSCKIQGKYMQLPSLVRGLSAMKKETVRWWPLIKAFSGMSEKGGRMK